jgi:hypothetical protein
MPIQLLTDFAGIEAAIQQWLATYSALGTGQVVWLNQAGTLPAKPYATLTVMTDGKAQNWAETIPSYNTTTQLIEPITRVQNEIVINVEVYSDGVASPNPARVLLVQALLGLEAEANKDAFAAVGLAYLDHQPITTPDVQVSTGWERRAVCDVRFSYVAAVQIVGVDGQQWIQTVPDPQVGTTLTNGTLIIED